MVRASSASALVVAATATTTAGMRLGSAAMSAAAGPRGGRNRRGVRRSMASRSGATRCRTAVIIPMIVAAVAAAVGRMDVNAAFVVIRAVVPPIARGAKIPVNRPFVAAPHVAADAAAGDESQTGEAEPGQRD